ncbi:DNA-binding protein [Niveibacterium sp. SC-1]|uniref:DNA-binding protein n=1 Tax=Niveibacterium sp. SC-1 TaxID=3135646 RepID=UPI0031201E38
MARSGIYKGEVHRARDRLLAQGRYPSLDAVRIELGNTGSKTTISRYLKELEEEDGGHTGNKIAISEALQDLVGRLAARLHEEADARVAQITQRHDAQLVTLKGELAELHSRVAGLIEELGQTSAAREAAETALADAKTTLVTAAAEERRLRQQVDDLTALHSQATAHAESLEAKHRQARDALEHFRSAAKEQREAEERRHEAEISYLKTEHRATQQALHAKQEECQRLARDNAKVAAEIAHARTENHTLQTQVNRSRQELDALQGTVEKAAGYAHELATARHELRVASERGAEAASELQAHQHRTHALELELAALRSTAALIEEIKAVMQPAPILEGRRSEAPSEIERSPQPARKQRKSRT